MYQSMMFGDSNRVRYCTVARRHMRALGLDDDSILHQRLYADLAGVTWDGVNAILERALRFSAWSEARLVAAGRVSLGDFRGASDYEARRELCPWKYVPYRWHQESWVIDGEPMILQDMAKAQSVSHQALSIVYERATRKLRSQIAHNPALDVVFRNGLEVAEARRGGLWDDIEMMEVVE